MIVLGLIHDPLATEEFWRILPDMGKVNPLLIAAARAAAQHMPELREMKVSVPEYNSKRVTFA